MINKHTKVSVCVLTYNHEKYIQQCLQSIVEQVTDFDFEVIVGDDCSSDGAQKIILDYANKYPKIIKPILRMKNVGALSNFFEIHNQAVGDYVAMIDGDDFMLPGKLQQQKQVLDGNPLISVCGHISSVFHDQLPSSLHFPVQKIAEQFSLRDFILYGMPCASSTLMYRKSSRSIKLHSQPLLDWYFLADFLNQGDLFILNSTLGVYRINHSSETSRMGEEGMRYRLLQMYELLYNDRPEYKAELFAVILLDLVSDIKNGRKISQLHQRLIKSTLTIFAIPIFYKAYKMRKLQIRNGISMQRTY